jgi:hypothetical protein
LLAWWQEEGKRELSQQEADVFAQALDLRHFHGQLSERDAQDALRAQRERRAALYAQAVGPPSRPRQHPLALSEVAREACAKEFVAPTGERSCEDARALLDRASRQWVWAQVPNPMMLRPQEPPTLEQCQLVFRLVQAFAETALSLPLVQEVIAFLRLLVHQTFLAHTHRQAAQKLLRALLDQLVPSLHTVIAHDMSLHACLWRASMLADYEQAYRRLKKIMQETRRNPDNRLLTLKERYPAIPHETLQTWKANACAQIALQLVSTRNDLTPQTIRRVLVQARKERQQRQHASHPPDAMA